MKLDIECDCYFSHCEHEAVALILWDTDPPWFVGHPMSKEHADLTLANGGASVEWLERRTRVVVT